MDSNTIAQLRIYAMLMRLSELRLESHLLAIQERRRILLLNAKSTKITIMETPKINRDEYFKPLKLHPKHQKSNKYRFNK